ncbi:MAG TPA: hypothetical protein VHZ51_04780 [Ktedonobacteraceae bacterium]|nr:hypothetical protein [Ktedonobacteraceae bacterium]
MLDQAIDDLPSHRHSCRFDQRESRTAGEKRAAAPPTDHPASTRETTRLPEDGSIAAGTPGQNGPNVETGAVLVQPETLLGFHRELFRVFWKRKSRGKVRASVPKLSTETINLIKEMATNNRLWGAERIRGELLKLDIRMSKRSIQKYMKDVRPKHARGQTWRTFLHNHAAEMPGVGGGGL